jgi:hypothetical protein
MQWTRTYADDDLRCSFCRRQENEVGALIPSPGKPQRYICADCVAVCNGILEKRGRQLESNRIEYDEIIEVKYHYEPEPEPPRRKVKLSGRTRSVTLIFWSRGARW